ncbi:Liprin-alpha-2, partial [Plecturocebus cupreus]
MKVKSLGDHEWNRTQQIGVLSSHPFESDTEMSDIDDDDRETIFSSMDLLSPSGHSDAQTLAMMLQEQLDAINKEIRLECSNSDMAHCSRNLPVSSNSLTSASQ